MLKKFPLFPHFSKLRLKLETVAFIFCLASRLKMWKTDIVMKIQTKLKKNNENNLYIASSSYFVVDVVVVVQAKFIFVKQVCSNFHPNLQCSHITCVFLVPNNIICNCDLLQKSFNYLEGTQKPPMEYLHHEIQAANLSLSTKSR